MRSVTEVLMVEKRRPITRNPFPCTSGRLGLMVATSNFGSASGAIGFNFGGGSGIVHAVSGVARVRFKGNGFGPWIHVPEIEFPSPLNLPSYSPPIPGNGIFTLVPCNTIGPEGKPCPL